MMYGAGLSGSERGALWAHISRISYEHQSKYTAAVWLYSCLLSNERWQKHERLRDSCEAKGKEKDTTHAHMCVRACLHVWQRQVWFSPPCSGSSHQIHISHKECSICLTCHRYQGSLDRHTWLTGKHIRVNWCHKVRQVEFGPFICHL